MREIPEDVLFDQRLIERYIAKGYITREQVNEQLAKISDSGDLGEVVNLDVLLDGKAIEDPGNTPREEP